MSKDPNAPAPEDAMERMLGGPRDPSSAAHSDFFYRQLALHMAKEATSDFKRLGGPHDLDGAQAVLAFLKHERDMGRLKPHDIEAAGSGFRVQASVHSCPYEGTCRGNLTTLGEVPQCLRAIMLIEAISAKIPDRPPMTYDLEPGLVDRTSDACDIKLRPAGVPEFAPGPVSAKR